VRRHTPHATYPGTTRAAPYVPLFGLAPSGVYHAVTVTSHAVRSYRTISPLPAKAGGIFLLHWPSVLTAQALPGTLPYGARTFLHPITEMIEQRLPGQLSLRKIQGNRAKRKEEIR